MTATLTDAGEDQEAVPATGGPDGLQPATPPSRVPAALRPWHDPAPWVGWALALLVTGIGGFVRLWELGYPTGKQFDEAYYATEAQEMLRYGYEDNRGYMFIVHPPLGKWLIALSSAVFGNNEIGWRVAPAVCGTLGVLVLARTARRMLHSNVFGGVAGLLLALEGTSVVLSRSALLDIFLQFFVLASFAALVLDRDQVRGRLARLLEDGADLDAGAPPLGPRPWRLAGGVLIGAACAVKWTALSFFLGWVLLSLVWDRGALKAAGVASPWRATLRRSVPYACGSLVLAPIATYLFSWLGWFAGENSWNREWADSHGGSATLNLLGVHIPWDWGFLPGAIRALGSYHLNAYRFHEGLDSFHPYRSNPWNWLVLGRPVLFTYTMTPQGQTGYAQCGAKSCVNSLLLIGTPIMWWAFTPMLLWLAWHWFTTRDWRAGAVWIAFGAGWLVWFQDLKRTMFLFYIDPLVPFLILGLTLALGVMLGPSVAGVGDAALLRRRFWGRVGVSVFLGLVIADFIWMWPLFHAGTITYDSWRAHMWFPSWV